MIGTDTRKRTHTCGAVDAGTGRLAGETTAAAREPGFRELLAWGQGLDEERIWAIEECRHVSGAQGRVHAPAREFLARKQAEGRSRREALRCLKRHLARRVWRLLLGSERGRSEDTVDAQRDLQGPQITATA